MGGFRKARHGRGGSGRRKADRFLRPDTEAEMRKTADRAKGPGRGGFGFSADFPGCGADGRLGTQGRFGKNRLSSFLWGRKVCHIGAVFREPVVFSGARGGQEVGRIG